MGDIMKRGGKAISIGLSAVMGLTAAGCGQPGTDSTQESVPYVPEVIGIYEAEEAAGTGNVKAAVSLAKEGYSGNGYVEGFENDDDSCTFAVDIPENGFYDLNFVCASLGGEKDNYVKIDGESTGTIHTENGDFSDCVLERVYLEAGTHKVSVVKYWGWISLDCLKVTTSQPISSSLYKVDAALCNKKHLRKQRGCTASYWIITEKSSYPDNSVIPDRTAKNSR